MHHTLNDKLPGLALRVLAVGLLLLALVLWAVRLALPELVPDYRATLELRLAEELDQPVAVESLELEWRGWRPVLRADGVAVGPEESALGFQALQVEVAPVASLLTRQLVVRDLALLGLRLEAGLDERGRPVVRGLEGLTLADEPFDLERLADFDWSLLPARMRLEDAQVRWEGADGRIWELPGVARLEREPRRLRVAVALEPPSALGERLQGHLELALSRRGGLPDGQLHIDGRGLVLEALPGLLPTPEPDYQLQGRADLALWGAWANGEPTALISDFEFQDLEWRREPDAELAELARRVTGVARWSGTPADWRIDVNGLVLERPDQTWAAQDAAFAHRRPADGGFALEAVFDRAHLDDLVRLAELSPGRDQPWLQPLRTADPYGELQAAHLRLRLGPDGGLQRLDSAARLLGVGLAPVGEVPGFGPVDGRFRTTEAGGRGAVSAQEAVLDFPQLFPEALPVSEARADLRWWRDDEGRYRVDVDDIAMNNPDARAAGTLSLAGAPGERPWMRLQAQAQDGDASRTARYLPIRFLPPAARDWLAAAVIGGEVPEAEVFWDGPLSGEAFRAGEVAFQAGGRVVNGELAYLPDWPHLTGAEAELDFRGRSMHIRGHGGRLAGAEVQQVEVTLPDLFEPVLAVHGRVQGGGEDYLDYLRQMPLTAELLTDVVPMALDGEHALTLGLTVPLRDFHPDRIRLDGRLALGEGARYRLPRWDLTVDDLAGEVRFDERGVSASDLRARYLGHPLRVDAHTDEQRIWLRGRTRGAPEALFPQLPLPEGWTDGESAWRADLQLPDFRPGGPEDVLLRLSSALEGVAIDLPDPLGKPANEARNLVVETRVDAEGLGPVRWRYHDQLNGVLALDPDTGAIPRLGVRLDGEWASLPESRRWEVRGRVPPLALDPWLDWLERQAPETDPGRPEWPEDLPPLALDLRFQRLSLGEALTLSDQRLVLAAEDHPDWRLQLDGPVSGSVFWPLHPAPEAPVRAELERLDLDLELFTEVQEERAEIDPEADPAQRLRPGRLPPLDLTIEQLAIDRRDLGRLDLQVRPEGESAHFQDIRLETPSFSLAGDLAWHYQDGGHRTEFESRLEGDRAGDILATLGYLPTVSRGRTEIVSDVAWNNLPHRFTLAEMEGDVSLRIDEGQIPDLSPGAGRLFGLLSVTTLPRRLALDFSDIFGRGFAFDRLRADLALADGQAQIQRFDIDGPAAKLAIDGRIGLRERDYDQTVQVTPRLGATMPLVGFIVGGPVGAAAGWLADRVAGDEVERATRYSYRVTGPWDDPKVERRGAE